MISSLWLVSAIPGTATSSGAQPLRYQVRFPAPQTHYMEVEVLVPAAGRAEVLLMMPVWTPGSYRIHDYSRHVENVEAEGTGGETLLVRKTRKNRWAVTTGGQPEVRFSYRVYCREMAVHANYIERDFAILNGAPSFVTLVEPDGALPKRPHQVELFLPPNWPSLHTGLPRLPGGAGHHYLADDYDTLVDSPMLAGGLAVYDFDVGGKSHYLVNLGQGGVWDGPRSAEDARKVVEEQVALWGTQPYESYSFLNAMTEGSSGLEHRNSTLMMTSRWATRSRGSYLGWLNLVSHEFFHTWNVKRLRPAELDLVNYEREVYTTGLWIAEGITSYYTPLILRRAGLIDDRELLAALSRMIQQVQTAHGRLVQPLAGASFDTWLKFQRGNENSRNTSISYYLKGAVVGFLLDAEIQSRTAGNKNLDDVMRLAFERYSGRRGFSGSNFREAASEVAGSDLSGWFRSAIETTQELDYGRALDWFGLRFRGRREESPNAKEQKPQQQPDSRDEGKTASGKKDLSKAPAWLGVRTSNDGGRLLVAEVLREAPAYEAGLNVDDEIIAIGDYRVPAGQFGRHVSNYQAGDKLSILVARNGRLVRLEVTAGARPSADWKLEIDPGASKEQKKRFDAWLASSQSSRAEDKH